MSNTAKTCQQFVVAGCGAMGFPMLRQLLQHDFMASGFDVRPASDYPGYEQHMLSGLTFNNAVAARDTVLLLVVRDSEQILDVCFKEQAVFRQPVYPGTVVVSSTISPRFIPEFQQQLPDDVDLVDAPMSGAPYSAEDGTLTFMLGGDTRTVDLLMPALKAMSEDIHHMGSLGQGMLTKVLNNYVAATSVVSVRRSLQRARDAGLDTDRLLAVMKTSSGATWFGDNIERINWADEVYSLDNTIGILEKDVKCGLDVQTTGVDDFDRALLQALKDI